MSPADRMGVLREAIEWTQTTSKFLAWLAGEAEARNEIVLELWHEVEPDCEESEVTDLLRAVSCELDEMAWKHELMVSPDDSRLVEIERRLTETGAEVRP